MSKLTPKQSRFVEEYLIDLNISAAARRAGYSERSAASSGFQNMQHPQIQAQIQQAMQQRTHRTQVDQDYVLEVIRSTIERCRQAEAVTDRHGEPVYVADEQGELRPVYRFEATLVLKGAEMLGKHLGMFKDKTESHANEDAQQMPTVIELVAPDV